jgi:hypothetical protein
MSLADACLVLTSHAHCGDVDWSVARDGTGPHAVGHHREGPRRHPTILLSAADAVCIADAYAAAEWMTEPCEPPRS